tara:strand:+ start:7580 stop:8527 length:948 start_codon:yes stop_codon:yes gene_type:complete
MASDAVELEDLPGVGPAAAEKLREGKFLSIEAIATESPAKISEATGIGIGSCTKIVIEARKLAEIGEFITGDELEKRRGEVQKLTTGSNNLNELLGGGIETQSISEFYGEFGSGKTQIIHQLLVTVQLPEEEGGLNGHGVLIDTENTFRPERIKSMAEGYGLDPAEVLSKIHVGRAYNSDQQMLMVDKAVELAEKYPVKLLGIDSLTSAFRAEFLGRGTLAERQQKLRSHMRDLDKFMDLTNAATVVTNQVHSNPQAMFGDPTKPVGGHIVGHTSKFRIYLRKGKAGTRVCRLKDSPHLPESEAVISVLEEGIRD